jgi:hypothetical protein
VDGAPEGAVSTLDFPPAIGNENLNSSTVYRPEGSTRLTSPSDLQVGLVRASTGQIGLHPGNLLIGARNPTSLARRLISNKHTNTRLTHSFAMSPSLRQLFAFSTLRDLASGAHFCRSPSGALGVLHCCMTSSSVPWFHCDKKGQPAFLD